MAVSRLIFRPGPASYGPDLEGLQTVPTGDGTSLAVLHLPHPTTRRTVFYFHGNAEDLGDVLPQLHELHRAGLAVLAFDYRGYGLTNGRATETNVYADTQAVFAFAKTRLGVTPEEMLLLGWSLGSGPAIELATQVHVAGLVLVSPFASVFRLITRVKLLPFDPFDNLAKAPRVRCPTLVVHGTRDELIPLTQAKRLFAALPGPKSNLWIEGAGHNDILSFGDRQVVRAIIAFDRSLRAPS